VELTVLANRYVGRSQETTAWTAELTRGIGEKGLTLARKGDYQGAFALVAKAERLSGQAALVKEFESDITRLRAQQMMSLSQAMLRDGQRGRAHALQFSATQVLGGQVQSGLLESIVDANSVSIVPRGNNLIARRAIDSLPSRLKVDMVRWSTSTRADRTLDVTATDVRCDEQGTPEMRSHRYLASVERQLNPEWLRLDRHLLQITEEHRAAHEQESAYQAGLERAGERLARAKRRMAKQRQRFDEAQAKRDAAQASLDKASRSLQDAQETLAALLEEQGTDAAAVEAARREVAAAAKQVAALHTQLADPNVENRARLETSLVAARVRLKKAGEVLQSLAAVVDSAQVIEVRKRIALATELVESKTKLLDIERTVYQAELQRRRKLRGELKAATRDFNAAETALTELNQRLDALMREERRVGEARDRAPRELEVEVYADWPYEVITWQRTCSLSVKVRVSGSGSTESLFDNRFTNKTTDISWAGERRVGLEGDMKSYPMSLDKQGAALGQSLRESIDGSLRGVLLSLRAQRLDELLRASDAESAATRATLLWFLGEDNGSEMQRLAERDVEK